MDKVTNPSEDDLAQHSNNACQDTISLLIVYSLLYFALIPRICTTSYMSLKFSCGKNAANGQLLQTVFSYDTVDTAAILEAEKREQLARIKARQLKRFYDDYA